MKEKKDLQPGIRYRGYGFLNEFGEFQFEPEETGSRQGVIKTVIVKDNYRVLESEKFVFVRMKVEKEDNVIDRFRKFLKIMNELVTIFKEYDF